MKTNPKSYPAQGSVLNLLLFLLYINDLHWAIKLCETFHFADGTHLQNFAKSIVSLCSQTRDADERWCSSCFLCLRKPINIRFIFDWSFFSTLIFITMKNDIVYLARRSSSSEISSILAIFILVLKSFCCVMVTLAWVL